MLIPTGFAQANLVFAGSGVPTGAEVTLGLNHELDPGNPSQVAEEVFNVWVGSGIMALVSNTVALTKVMVKFGPNDVGPAGEYSASSPGTNTNPQAPPNVAMLVRKITASGGRTGRGRLYLPGVPEAAISAAGDFTPAFMVDAVAAFQELGADLVTGGLQPVLLHDEDSPISTPINITSFSPQQRAATQRRRLRR